jgi:hypothetical protein
MRSSGRGRLPTWVVRMRLLLRFIKILHRRGFLDFHNFLSFKRN